MDNDKKQTIIKLAEAAQERKPAPEAAGPARTVEIVDDAPEAIRRPLCLVSGHAYAATWLWVKTTIRQEVDKEGRQIVHDPPLKKSEQVLTIIRDDGAVFSDGPVDAAEPLAELGLEVCLPAVPPPGSTWSGAGFKRFLAGERPDPADVLRRVGSVVGHFMDFSRSLAPQETMCELLACYVLATYGLDAFNVIGYVWPNGTHGAAKTKCLNTITSMAYLGMVILAGGSYASLRDLADYGATLAFDDAENVMDLKRGDPDKRTLLLAGNRRGAVITIKEPVGKRGWVTRHINAFCPRLFSAIRLPDAVLGSRAIVIPLVRSAVQRTANADPCDPDAWPCDRRRLIDDLWAVGLTSLPRLRVHDVRAAAQARLSGRNLEPWRAILAVALWLQEEHGVAGLYGRLEALSVAYQSERADLEADNLTRLAILALRAMSAVYPGDVFTFKTAELAERVNALAEERELVPAEGEKFTNTKRLGKLLSRLRLTKARDANKKGWTATRGEVRTLAVSYGLASVATETNGINGTNGKTAPGDEGENAVMPFLPSVPFTSGTSSPTEGALRTAAPGNGSEPSSDTAKDEPAFDLSGGTL